MLYFGHPPSPHQHVVVEGRFFLKSDWMESTQTVCLQLPPMAAEYR